MSVPAPNVGPGGIIGSGWLCPGAKEGVMGGISRKGRVVTGATPLRFCGATSGAFATAAFKNPLSSPVMATINSDRPRLNRRKPQSDRGLKNADWDVVFFFIEIAVCLKQRADVLWICFTLYSGGRIGDLGTVVRLI